MKVFLSPIRPHKSNVYENIYFLFKITHTQIKKILLANYSEEFTFFSREKIKDRVLCFSAKKSAVRVVF